MKLFDHDGPLMRALTYLGNLILLNLVFLLCCIPVVTTGAACAALYTVTLGNLRGEDGGTVRRFFRAFRANFKKATVEWLVMLAAAAVIFVDFRLLMQTDFALKRVVELVFLCVLFLYLPTLQFLFPIQAYYENSIAKTLKNAVALGIAKLPQAILLLALNGFPLVFLYFNLTTFFRLLPLWSMIGFAATAQLGSRLLLRIFKKLA